MISWQRTRGRRPSGRARRRSTARACAPLRRLQLEELESRLAPSVSGLPDTALVNRPVTTDPGVQQMPSVAVDPHDADHVVIAYMDYSLVSTGYAGIAVAVSHDGGDSWQYSAVPLPAGFDQGAANPITHFDDQGHVFVSFMAVTFLGPKAPLTNPNFDTRGLPGIE